MEPISKPSLQYCQELADSWFQKTTREIANECKQQFTDKFLIACQPYFSRGTNVLGGIFACSIYNKSKD